MSAIQQLVLNNEQVVEFYHNVLVTTQVRDFVNCADEAKLPSQRLLAKANVKLGDS